MSTPKWKFMTLRQKHAYCRHERNKMVAKHLLLRAAYTYIRLLSPSERKSLLNPAPVRRVRKSLPNPYFRKRRATR